MIEAGRTKKNGKVLRATGYITWLRIRAYCRTLNKLPTSGSGDALASRGGQCTVPAGRRSRERSIFRATSLVPNSFVTNPLTTPAGTTPGRPACDWADAAAREQLGADRG